MSNSDRPARTIGLVVGGLTIAGALFGGISKFSGKADAADVTAVKERVIVIETVLPEFKQDLTEIKDLIKQLMWNGCAPAAPPRK